MPKKIIHSHEIGGSTIHFRGRTRLCRADKETVVGLLLANKHRWRRCRRFVHAECFTLPSKFKRKSPKKKCYEEKMCGWQASGCDDNVGWRVMKKIGTKRQPFGFNDDDNSEKKVKSTVHITCPLCRPGRYVSAGKPPTASFHTTHPGVALNAIANSIEGHKMAIILYFMT